MRQIILDTETTGFSPEDGDRVIEIGCREIIDRRIIDDSEFHIYISPGAQLVGDSVEVHGLTDEFLADKPTFPEIMDAFLDWIGDSEIIAHNAQFDINFLDHELMLAGSTYRLAERNQITDTLLLAREQFPGQRNSLDALCKRYNVDNSSRQLHGALIDADLLAKVYLNLTGGQFELLTVDEQDDTQTAQQYPIHPTISNLEPFIAAIPIVTVTDDHQAAHQAYLNHLNVEKNRRW